MENYVFEKYGQFLDDLREWVIVARNDQSLAHPNELDPKNEILDKIFLDRMLVFCVGPGEMCQVSPFPTTDELIDKFI